MDSSKKNAKFSLPSRKVLLLSFFLPVILAGALYQCVYVEDAAVRTQGIDSLYPNVPINKALELEKEHRWVDPQAWLIHLLIFGTPSGLIVVSIACGIHAIAAYKASSKSG